ncbi:kinesin light chain [Amanita rubescens]|nr:kinesin light chain [Amanita rubescens]
MGNLATNTIYQYQGIWDEAEKLQVEVMNIQKIKLGLDHPGTLATLPEQFGINIPELGKLGSEHLNTLHVMANLALTYKSQERFDVAESLLSYAVQTMEKVMGSQHQTTLCYGEASCYDHVNLHLQCVHATNERLTK